MQQLTDAEFTSRLRSHLSQSKEGIKPVVPLIKNADGTINREETLSLPCYQNFTDIIGSAE